MWPSIFNKLLHFENSILPTVLRLALGIVIFPHGAQKVMGWFGGYGFEATMSRFALEVVDVIATRIGDDRTALRISPGAYINIVGDNRDRDVFDYLLKELEDRNLAFLHLGGGDDSLEFDYLGGKASNYLRENYSKTLVGVGNYTAKTASVAIAENQFDLIAIGCPFIANPDFVTKVREGR